MECFKDSKSYNIDKPSCLSCKKNYDFNKAIDLSNRESIKRIEFIYEDPEILLKKVTECIKFQKLHKKKYVDFLEKKVESIINENKKLKEQLANHKIVQLNQLNQNFNSTYPYNSSNLNNPSPNFIDMMNVKKIEQKKPDRNSNKISSIHEKNYSDQIKTNNLNARTAENLRNSPTINFNTNNNNSNNKSLIKINVNNTNNLNREEMSNFEKNLFKQGQNVISGNNIIQSLNNSNSNIVNSSYSTNPSINHQKNSGNYLNNQNLNILSPKIINHIQGQFIKNQVNREEGQNNHNNVKHEITNKMNYGNSVNKKRHHDQMANENNFSSVKLIEPNHPQNFQTPIPNNSRNNQYEFQIKKYKYQ